MEKAISSQTKAMKAVGFSAMPLGPDGPEAWTRAKQLNEDWQRIRRGEASPINPRFPRGSFGEAFTRLKRTDRWERMAPRTQEDWERGQRMIEGVFGDQQPKAISYEHLDRFYSTTLARKGPSEAYKAIKHWRRLWQMMAAMGYEMPSSDPSRTLRVQSPKPRTGVWREGEIVRLVKHAIRQEFLGLACVIAMAWDTQFSPADIRSLTAKNVVEKDGQPLIIDVRRQKTGSAIIGTLSSRTYALLLAYLKRFPPDGEGTTLIRHRKNRPYTKDGLAADFRKIREKIFPGDRRALIDIRRSAAVEASAGNVDMNALAAKMGNQINTSRALQKTYQPVNLASVLEADEARKRGRRALRDKG
ncbi:hypothetical protein AAG604_03770 [Citromicrobium bathyomarinum]